MPRPPSARSAPRQNQRVVGSRLPPVARQRRPVAAVAARSRIAAAMSSRLRIPQIVGAYPELLLVILAAALGLAVARPLRWADDHQAIDALLVVLVFATAVTVSANSLRQVLSSWKHLVIALVMGVTVLPVLSWLASRLVAAGSLRDGIMVVGIAPCEIASVATTALAGGGTALAGALLIGSTLLSVAFAGLILSVRQRQRSRAPAPHPDQSRRRCRNPARSRCGPRQREEPEARAPSLWPKGRRQARWPDWSAWSPPRSTSERPTSACCSRS